jgi:hypothetical protein
MSDWYDDIQESLDGQDYSVGDEIQYPSGTPRLIVGNGGNGRYLLAAIGIDRFGRVWRQDNDGMTMVADFSANIPPKG